MSGDNTPPDPDPNEPLPQEPAGELEDDGFEFSVADLEAHFETPPEALDDPDPEDPDPAAAPEGEGDEDPDPAEEPAGEPAVEQPAAEDPPAPAPEPEPAPEPAPTPPPSTVAIGGREYAASDIEALVTFIETLTPEQIAYLNNPQAATPPGQPSPAPAPDAPDPNALPGEDEIVDPRLAEWTAKQLDAVNARLEAIQRAEDVRAQQEAQIAEQQFAQAFDTARSGTMEQFGLSDAEADMLLKATEQSGVVAFIASQNPAMPTEQLLSSAFEMTFWSTPAFRDRAVGAQAEAIAGERGIDARLAERKANNASLVGSGAVTPRVQKQTPQTPEDHDRAAIDLVNEAMQSGNS